MSDFKAKIAPNSIWAGDPPQTPLGELAILPQTLELDLRGPISKCRRYRGEDKRKEVTGGKGMGVGEADRGRALAKDGLGHCATVNLLHILSPWQQPARIIFGPSCL